MKKYHKNRIRLNETETSTSADRLQHATGRISQFFGSTQLNLTACACVSESRRESWDMCSEDEDMNIQKDYESEFLEVEKDTWHY